MAEFIARGTLAVSMLATAAWGATATFTPLGPTTVPPGTDVLFEVTVAVETLGSFDAADAIIGSNDAADIGFEYSAEWSAAFSNVTPPVFDVGVYDQDVFVGGNNPNPVGSSLLLGTVTVSTTGLSQGAYDVTIDNALDFGVSTLALAGVSEPLVGTGTFTIESSGIPTISQWGTVVLALLGLTAGTIIFNRAAGSSRSAVSGAQGSPRNASGTG